MKKLKTALLVALFGTFSALNAQCPQGNVNLYYQADIHSYAAAFANCDYIDGNLALGKPGIVSDIHDLSALSMLKGIGGTLIIYGAPNLASLDGLQNLEYIGKDLSLVNNASLNSLEGLQSLAQIDGTLHLSNLNEMTSMEGLENLVSIGKDLSLSYTPNMASLQGLNALKSIGGNLFLQHNLGITTMQGLNSLETIGIDLILLDNPALIRLDGLENLNAIGRNLNIGKKYSDGNTGNSSLTDIEALNGLQTIGAQLSIVASPNLSACNVNFVCAFLSNGGFAIIEDNAPGCESKEDVMEACGLTAVEEIAPGSIRIRPNPASEWMNIDSPLPLEYLSIFNGQGQLIYESFAPGAPVDLSGFAKGLYVVRMKIQGKEFAQRLMVQ